MVTHDDGAVNALPVPRPRVSVRSSADGLVFAEEGNDDGWIVTDVTVTLER